MSTSPMERSARRESPTCRPTTPLVFVVDDDISVRESLELLIGSAGWRVETAANFEIQLSLDPFTPGGAI
jgi:FixJ family two-component response regulator